MSTANKVNQAGLIIGGLGVIGFLVLIWLLIYGVLDGNLGFDAGTAGYNNTQNALGNFTEGFSVFSSFAPTFFTIAAIVLLVFMLVGLLLVVMTINKKKKGGFN